MRYAPAQPGSPSTVTSAAANWVAADTEALGPLLRQVQAETGSALLVIEHDMALLSSLCDRLVAMELGQVIALGTPADVLAHERVITSYLGTDVAAIQRSGPVKPAAQRAGRVQHR